VCQQQLLGTNSRKPGAAVELAMDMQYLKISVQHFQQAPGHAACRAAAALLLCAMHALKTSSVAHSTCDLRLAQPENMPESVEYPHILSAGQGHYFQAPW
jgi:hypothetical protein